MIYIDLYIHYRIIVKMDIHEKDEPELSWEEWDARQEEERVEFLKGNFTFFDFWNYEPTQQILKNEYLQKYIDTAGKDIRDFYRREVEHSHSRYSSLFALDPHHTKNGFLESIIYNHIEKEYDIDIFYQNTDWTDGFVVYQLNSKEKKKEGPKMISKKTLRKFDWGTKTYKKGKNLEIKN